MTNSLVGDIYQKIIEEVVAASSNDFEELAVPSSTLQEMQQEWQAKISLRGVAQMPWDPKPEPPAPQQPAQRHSPPAVPNGLPQPSYPQYDNNQTNGVIKVENDPGVEPQYNGLPPYSQTVAPTQGGSARAQQLMQQSFGSAANASLNAMQQRGGLALPGQNVKPPQVGQLPAGNPNDAQRAFQYQQQQAMQRQQQHHQGQPHVKIENTSPVIPQGSFDQKPSVVPDQKPIVNYTQTDGADDAMDEWRAQLAQRRALATEQTQHADRMMHDRIMNLSREMQSGLMVPLDEQPSRKKSRKSATTTKPRSTAQPSSSSSSAPRIPQLDGDFDDDDDTKPALDDEDDENAINSDLDDSDEDGQGDMGDDDDDMGDSILCTYDRVQRVKNKWKCTLKDGIMTVNGRDWVFAKGTGEFEW